MAKPLIMVVDDEIDIANVIANIIKDTNRYDVVIANSAKEAFEQLQKNKIFFGLGGNRIHFVFLDIKMPHIDGLTFLEIVRRKFGEDIAVSMLTGMEDAEKWERATAGFVVNYIKKPFKKEEIVKTLDDFFSGNEGKMVLKTFEKHMKKRESFKKSTR